VPARAFPKRVGPIQKQLTGEPYRLHASGSEVQQLGTIRVGYVGPVVDNKVISGHGSPWFRAISLLESAAACLNPYVAAASVVRRYCFGSWLSGVGFLSHPSPLRGKLQP
jgi:hypothetical protein